MDKRERLINLYLLLLGPLSLIAVCVALYTFPVERIDAGLLAVCIITIFLGSTLRIQLPRNNIHLTISDALLILTMLVYGEQPAVILAVFEGAITSINFRRKGVPVKTRTIVMNMQIAAIGFFITSLIVESLIGREPMAASRLDFSAFAALMLGIAFVLFILNTAMLSPFLAMKSEKSIFQVWNEYCLDALVMYLIGGVVAGLMFKSLEQINIYMFAAVIGVFGLVYWAYRRNIDDVRKTSAEIQEAERKRAEQAETHLTELEQYITQLEESGNALRESRESFEHAAFHDALTGLPNRNYVVDRLEQLLTECKNDPGKIFTVLFLNLNRFRTINESMSHATGDRVIREVAKRINEAAGRLGVVGHFGGDEFAVILPDFKGRDIVEILAENIARKIAEPIRFKSLEVYTSVSIGIAVAGSEYDRPEFILRDADIAMYNAKDNRKPLVMFDTEMYTSAVERQELESDLRYAIVCNELELYYQPIVRLETAELCGFEALIRWNHPKRGLVSPADFIPLAESTGLVIPMTIDILRVGCRQLVEWEERLGRRGSLMLSVNLSVTHFGDPALVDQIKSIIAETGILPSSLKLEITESAVMENAESAISMLKRIKAAGVSISIDDFGTGYSSLSYLHRFPLDYLKIDRSFVNSMDEGSDNREIVRTIVALAKALRLSIIAEGIETSEQLDGLRKLGCEFGQGYLFSRALPVSEINATITDKARWADLVDFPKKNQVPTIELGATQ